MLMLTTVMMLLNLIYHVIKVPPICGSTSENHSDQLTSICIIILDQSAVKRTLTLTLMKVFTQAYVCLYVDYAVKLTNTG